MSAFVSANSARIVVSSREVYQEYLQQRCKEGAKGSKRVDRHKEKLGEGVGKDESSRLVLESSDVISAPMTRLAAETLVHQASSALMDGTPELSFLPLAGARSVRPSSGKLWRQELGRRREATSLFISNVRTSNAS